MREDVLARRLFYVGCLGLPWLWIVHILYWFGKQHRNSNNNDDNDDGATNQQNDGLMDGESTPTEQTPANPEDVLLEERKWVRRELVGSVVVVMAWITWVIVFRLLQDYFPRGFFVQAPDDGEFSGW